MKITLEKLNKSYTVKNKGYDEKINAVRDFSVVIPDGMIVCLLGPSGCGKSTLLSLINGLETPDSGKIFFGDEEATSWSPQERAVGMAFQNYALYSHMTVRQNIRMPLENPIRGDKLSREEQDRKVDEIACLIQINDLLERKPDELSGGQQQRVSIARALVRDPEILLLDEPFSNLDKMLRMQILEEIRRIQNKLKVTTVFVTHDQEEAMRIADMIIVMRDGMILQCGTPAEVYLDPKNLFTARFLGYPQINTLIGRITSGNLYCGSDLICSGLDLQDQEVIIGVRPEDLIIREDGFLKCKINHLELYGKDHIATCEYQGNPISAYLPQDSAALPYDTVNFNFAKDKMLLFSHETEDRLKL